MSVFLVFVSSLALLLLGIDRSATNVFDEGEILVGAQYVAGGGVPYRDFWTAYGPGQYWVLGGLFRLLGPYVIVERAWDIVVRAALATLAYAMARDLCGRRIATVAWLFSLGWLWAVNFYGYPLIPAALFGLLGAYLVQRWAAAAGGAWTLYAAGASIGVASLFRFDVGISTLAAVAAATLAGPLAIDSPSPSGRVTRVRGRPFGLGVLLAGAVSVAGPVVVYLLARVPGEDLLHPLVVYPLQIYVPTRTLPLPSLVEPLRALIRGHGPGVSLEALGNAAILYFPWIVGVLGVAVFFRRNRRPDRPAPGEAAVRFAGRLLTLLVLVYSVKAVVRPQPSHVAHAIVPSAVLAGLMLSSARLPLSRFTAGAAVAILAVLAFPPVYAVYRDVTGPVSRSIAAAARESPARGAQRLWQSLLRMGNGPPPSAFFEIDPEQAAAVAYVHEHTEPTDRLFVGNGRHDLVVGNDVLFYFLAQRQPATKYYEFDPGVTTTAPIQAAIVDAIRRERVPYVVRLGRFDHVREPNRSALSSGQTGLDRFLDANYAPVARFGDYEIAKRRD